ncbi:uncharacterized protein LOC128854726 [Anastrepha ludens]|uniref:uncharacterized protein LOC128854726 n=1 Tax=Anastrepha ludens TaxID=28586 RepID=UPI0023AEBC2F|nr:uncharacterized protein LOC128854726 [Anastrepha ludens]
MEYLGVVIDDRLRFTNHAKYVDEKGQRVYKTVCRYVRPTRGVHAENVITIYKQVVEPTITNAASILGKAIQFNYIRRLLRSFLRNFAIRAIRGFHTVSANSALALAGFTPLHLKIKETMQIESVKLSGVYDETLNVMFEQRTTPKNELHPSERQFIRFESIASQQEADNITDANVTHIYTDVSKFEVGACGSAFVVHKQDDDWTSRKFKLHGTGTAFQAEALAIDAALK